MHDVLIAALFTLMVMSPCILTLRSDHNIE